MAVNNALIGDSGYVGTTLRRQSSFESKYRSNNIVEIEGCSFNNIICAAAPAQKWIANSKPETDLCKIKNLMEHLETVKCNTFILISTVDVFKSPSGVNENTSVDETGLHPYGLHRRLLEKFVEDHFSNHLIVRLPGLVGPGLRKNVIFDFLNNNNLHAIDSRGVFQFYPMVNLWYDIQIALQSGLKLIHLTAEPLSVANIAESCFGNTFEQILPKQPAIYDIQSNHAALFGGYGCYQYSRRETIQAIRAYVQSEPITLNRKDAQS